MAQLYKMTLYVCDLEDNLSLDGIETLIEQNALNGMFANCICHFADSQIGQNVGWDDAIDLNRCGCPTSAWDKYFAPPTKEKTNADRLMSMDDASKRDSLLTFFREWAGIGDSYIYDLTRIKTAFDVGTMSLDDFEEWDDGRITRLVDDFLEWLQQPAEEGRR